PDRSIRYAISILPPKLRTIEELPIPRRPFDNFIDINYDPDGQFKSLWWCPTLNKNPYIFLEPQDKIAPHDKYEINIFPGRVGKIEEKIELSKLPVGGTIIRNITRENSEWLNI